MIWANIVLGLTTLFLLVYAILIFSYRKWFLQLAVFKPASATYTTTFTIIIPARNEEDNIKDCVTAILEQEYPKTLFEVIVVDDHSTDATAQIVTGLQEQYANLKLIKLADVLQGKLLNAYKKKAIDTAIAQSSGDWIMTTDADCTMGRNWISSYAAYIEQYDPAFVAAAVIFKNTGSFISIFQCLDFISLQGITAASVSAGFHSMCNGANLAYKKEAFHAVGGFKGIDNIASGDDMLLMHKIKKQFPGKIGYLFTQSAIVSTLPMPDWKSFLNQRIRWASKADKYNDKGIIAVLACVYMLNFFLLFFPLLGFICTHYLLYWLGLLCIKTIVEMTFMIPAAQFFGQQRLMWWFPVMQPFHIAYTVAAGWLGKFGSYKWKERKVL
ncbi:MAG: glycosyltransferase [Filimonas sp.]|nr:glycosyltransferase [Filimonas sp.]